MPFEWNKTKTLGWRCRAVYYYDGTRDMTPWCPCEREGHKPEHLKRWLNNKESMHLHGRLGQADSTLTFAALIELWEGVGGLDNVADTNRRNFEGYLRWWREEFGTTEYGTVQRPFVQARLRSRWENPATRNRVRAAMGTVLAWALREGFISENKLEGLYEKEQPKTDDAYDDAELRALFDALAAEEKDPRPYVACAIAFSTGARQGAIWALQVQDIDLAANVIRFQRKVKRNRHRAVPLQPWVRDLILNRVWPRPDKVTPQAPLFQGARWGGMIWPRTVWARVLEVSGVARNKPFHTLRHTFVTRALGEGVSVQWVARFTGHSVTWILERYSHLTDQAMERAFSQGGEARTEAQRLADAAELPQERTPSH